MSRQYVPHETRETRNERRDPLPLLPFDRARGFAGNIVADPIDTFYLVRDACRNAGKYLVWDPHPVSGHAILAFDDPDGHGVFIGALVTHHTDRPDREKHRERLPHFVVPIGRLHLAHHDLVSLPQHRQVFFGDLAQDAHAQTGPGEGLTKYDLAGVLELEADLAHLVLKELAKRLQKFEIHHFGKSADVVVAFNERSRVSRDGDTLNHIRVKRALGKIVVAASARIRCFKFLRRFLENADEFASDRFTLLFRVGYAAQLSQKTLGSIDVLKRNPKIVAEDFLHRFGLARSQQAVVDEDASEPVLDRPMDESGSHRRIDTA